LSIALIEEMGRYLGGETHQRFKVGTRIFIKKLKIPKKITSSIISNYVPDPAPLTCDNL